MKCSKCPLPGVYYVQDWKKPNPVVMCFLHAKEVWKHNVNIWPVK